MNKRLLNLSDYGISEKRYKELKAFCEQYPDWKDELRYNTDTVKSKVITDMPLAPHGNSDATGDLACKRVDMESKVELIEKCALEACKGEKTMAYAIIKSTCYDIPFYDIDEAYCSKSTFFDFRRLFFSKLNEERN